MRTLKNIIATVKRLFVGKEINWEIESITVEEISSDDILTSEEIDELLDALKRQEQEEIASVLEALPDIEFVELPKNHKEVAFTKQEALEYCLDSNEYFANTNPELVFSDEEIEYLMSLANN